MVQQTHTPTCEHGVSKMDFASGRWILAGDGSEEATGD
jgi:hypothetical protein